MDIKDLLDRTLSTAVETGLSVLIVGLADIPLWWAAPLALVLTSVKVSIQQRRGAE